MITGYGVAEAVRHYYAIWGGQFEGKRAIIQGWGNVGAAAAFYLAAKGAKVVGIIDRAGGLINPAGYTFEEISKLFFERHGNALHAGNLLPFEEVNSKIWSLEAEVFVPAAASRLVTRTQLEQMIGNGLEVISCGANVPFQDPEIFFGSTGEFADQNIAVIPDFIANCGMARVFAYLMQSEVEITDGAIFSDVSDIIRKALEKAHAQNPKKTEIAKTSFEIALSQLL
jgi:glutamate dehydrogenase/leucine dehydrogenase